MPQWWWLLSMPLHLTRSEIVRAGDLEGRLSVYDLDGELMMKPSESLLGKFTGWEMTAISPWRRYLPNVIFLGLNKQASSRLYVTSQRVVLIRDVDPWRETSSDMTPLGMPNAAARNLELRQMKAAGARQFCEVFPNRLRAVQTRKSPKGTTWLGLRLKGDDGRQYRVSYWKTDGEDAEALSLIESRFHP